VQHGTLLAAAVTLSDHKTQVAELLKTEINRLKTITYTNFRVPHERTMHIVVHICHAKKAGFWGKKLRKPPLLLPFTAARYVRFQRRG
jgi:hypothetical protein